MCSLRNNHTRFNCGSLFFFLHLFPLFLYSLTHDSQDDCKTLYFLKTCGIFKQTYLHTKMLLGDAQKGHYIHWNEGCRSVVYLFTELQESCRWIEGSIRSPHNQTESFHFLCSYFLSPSTSCSDSEIDFCMPTSAMSEFLRYIPSRVWAETMRARWILKKGAESPKEVSY